MLNALPNVQATTAQAPIVDAAKKKNVRGTIFLTAEDGAQAKSWLIVSENPTIGAEQKGDDFYRTVTDVYNDKFKQTKRELGTVESVRKRVSKADEDQ
ncbi:unnamed protein product [Agarophyton chilense]